MRLLALTSTYIWDTGDWRLVASIRASGWGVRRTDNARGSL